MISVTTVTQVHALHISYLAWSGNNLNIVSGKYAYEYSASFEIIHTPAAHIGRNYARLHGLDGFIINHNSQALDFSTNWTGSKFIFDLGTSQRLTQFFSFQYVFFVGSECAGCTGYPLSYNGKCVSFCPPGSFPTSENTCIFCGDGYIWNGDVCQKQCPQGQILNMIAN